MTAEHHLIIITGANRGFGASVAHTYLESSEVSTLSYVLVGRNQAGLQTVLDTLKQTGASSNVTVKGLVVANVDLADTDKLDANFSRIQEAAKQLRDESLQSKVLDHQRLAFCRVWSTRVSDIQPFFNFWPTLLIWSLMQCLLLFVSLFWLIRMS